MCKIIVNLKKMFKKSSFKTTDWVYYPAGPDVRII